MREGWETKPLGKVCEIFGRIGFRGYNRTDIVNTPEEGAISLSPSNISNGKLTYEKPTYISWAKYEESPEIKIENNDVLFVKTGSTVGKCAKVENLPHPATINPQFVVLKNIILDNSYLCYYLQSEFFKEQLMKKVTGVAVPTTSQKSLGEMVVSYPIDKKEQLAVVEELDHINALIAIKEKQLQELEELEQTIFHEMFGDPIDNERQWYVDKFSNCFSLKSGTTLPSKKICVGDIPIYGGNGIVGYHNVHNLVGDNIIIGRVGALCGNVRNVIGDIFVTDNAFIMTKKVDMDNIFIEHLLKHINLRTYAHDALQPVISNTTLKNIDIILPPKSLQKRFADKIKQITVIRDNVNVEIGNLQELLASRMQYWFD